MRRYKYRRYEISRGDYQDCSDNRMDGWYINLEDSLTVDRRGPGFDTIKEAKEAIDAIHEQHKQGA